MSDEQTSSFDLGVEQVTDSELLEAHRVDTLLDLHTAIPVRVESYDQSANTVRVKPQTHRHVPDGDGGFVDEELPALDDVPVVWPRSQAFVISFPLVAGDFGLIVCCEKNIGAWRALAAPGDPGDVGTHTLSGAVFIPGLYPDSLATGAVSGNMLLGASGSGNAQIEITPSEIHLGVGATKGVARTGDNLSATTDSRGLVTWSGRVEAALISLGDTTFSDPKKTFDYDGGDGNGAGPGRAGRLGVINGGSTHAKAVD